MKRNFTRILAAFALLVFMMPSLVAWGQTKDEVVAYTLQPATGSNNNYASNCDITIDGITWNLTGNSTMIPWRIGGKSLSGIDRALYSKTAISDNISKIEVTHGAASSITVNSWTVIVASDADFTNVVSTLTPTFAANATTIIYRPDGKDWSNCYYKFVYNVTVSGSSNKFLEFSQAKFYKETGTTLQDSDMSLSPTALSFDLYNDAEAKTITISTSSTGAISVSNNSYVSTAVNGVATITVTPVAVTPEAQTITVSQAADNTYNAGEATFTVSVANSTPTYTVTYKANGGTGDDVVDTYYQGEDVTVRSNTFVYTGHAFTKWNTAANGSGMDYQPAATIENIQANVELFAQWEESNEVVDILTAEWTEVTGTTYTAWEDKSVNNGSGAVYAGNTNINNGGIGLRTKNSNEGIITTTSGGYVRKVSVTWTSTTANRTLDVYGKNTPYTAVTELFDADTQGTLLGSIVYGTSLEVAISGDYAYVGLRSHSDALGVDPICITWEPDDNPAVATAVTINVPEDFNTDIYQGTTAGTLTATITAGGEAISNATVTWSSSDETVATIDANGAVTLVAVGTTTITANYAGVEGQYRPSSDTYELSVIDSNAPGTENNPYTVAQARAAIDAGEGVNDVYATGIVSQIVTAYSSQYGNISYNISADGSTEADQLQAYRGKSYNGENFTSEDDIQVGDIVVVYGDLKNYNGTYEFDAGNQLVSLERPQSTEPVINANNPEILAYDATSGSIAYTITNPVEGVTLQATTTAEWISNVTVGESVVTFTTTANEGTADRNATITLSYTGATDKVVTVTQGHFVADFATLPFNWAGGTSAALEDLAGVTVNCDPSDYAASNAPYRVKFNEDGHYILIKTNEQPAVVSVGIKKYAAGNTASLTIEGSSDGVTFTEVQSFSITGAQNAVFTYITTNAFATTDRYVRIYYNKPNGGSNVGVGPIIIRGIESYPLTITGYASDDTKDGFYLIASPVSVNPATVEGMTEGDFDLYYYDDAEELEWRNYKTSAFNLTPGTGYLYAKKATTETPNYQFTLTGAPYAGQPIQLIQGWNLVGNPYGQTAYITNEYYVMNGEGSELVAGEGNAIDAMQGIFVNATEAGTMTFSTENNSKAVEQVVMNVTRNRSTAIDRAIVRFDEGQQLPKFQLNPNNTKLYIAQGNKDYAIVRSATQGEMPVSFRAAENGTYTLSIETENVEMDYLHLIDNMTGMDVDLLATPSYSFEARKNDYASRFRLVFSANGIDEQNAETFAFFNGSEWMVSNLGEATLQVVDVMGRVLSTETISGNAELSLNQPAGVYMLRLINGNDVKVQKVIVK